MGARSAGARGVSFVALVWLVLAVVVALVGGCTGGAEAVADSPPTSVATATGVPATSTALPEPTATVEPTPTVAPTVVVIPTPTPTGAELYGPLLVEGAYDWPQQMPDDLTDDELFAVNIFASAQNASFAAIEARSQNMSEFAPLDELIVDEVVANTARTVELDLAEELTQLFGIDGPTSLLSIERGGRLDDGRWILRSCEYIVSTFLRDDGTEQAGEKVTLKRDLRFEISDGVVRYEGWEDSTSVYGEGPQCDY